MLSTPRWCLAAVIAVALAATPGFANTTEVEARLVEIDLREWVSRQFGSFFGLAASSLRVVAQGDVLALELPFGGPIAEGAVSLVPGSISLMLKPLEGGRYAVENAHVSMPLSARVAKGPKGTPSEMTVNVSEQSVRGTIDPSLATTSTLDTRLLEYDVAIQADGGRQLSHADIVTSHSVWQPAGAGRVNMNGESVIEGYITTEQGPDGKPTRLSVDRIRVTGGVDQFDFTRLGAANRAFQELIGLAGGSGPRSGKVPLSPPQKAALRTVIGELGVVFQSLRSEQVWENARLQVGDQSGSLRRMALGFSMSAPNGVAEIRFPILLEGFDSPQIPPGPMRDVLPRGLSLTPRLSGLSKAGLLDLLSRAAVASPDRFDFETAADELLEQGRLSLGIEDFAIQIGPMKLSGEGAIEIAPGRQFSGEAKIRANGLDALIRRANAIPDLKPALPVLIFLKGIGRQDGREVVWYINYADREILVNDTNLSDMLPASR